MSLKVILFPFSSFYRLLFSSFINCCFLLKLFSCYEVFSINLFVYFCKPLCSSTSSSGFCSRFEFVVVSIAGGLGEAGLLVFGIVVVVFSLKFSILFRYQWLFWMVLVQQVIHIQFGIFINDVSIVIMLAMI